ncbi:MAG: rhomboid family intramembrane serine protease [Prolixibacteraceae bacterium]|nr:rhomboid family intramembrane serine protease [Prolixibacteraceae bacterium]MBN2775089.1 rhomboid family intramembrane serine protease [Prolixibacteraceae bacterium]
MNLIDEIKNSFKQGSVLTRLIWLSLGVFLFIRIIHIFYFISGTPFTFIDWLALPDNPVDFIHRPWTLVTYMFLHFDFLHILFNLIGLYWFGKLFLSRFEGDKLLGVYILGGLGGGLLYMLAYNLLPVFASVNAVLMGASASIIAILVAIAVYEPDREILLAFIGPVKLKYISVFYVLLSVIGISTSNPGGNIAHLGGALMGWLYMVQLRKGKDMSSGIVKLVNQIGKLFKPRQKIKVTYKQPPRDDYEYNRQKRANQEEINKILEKIAKSGYDSLSKREKEILFKQGKNNS